MTFPEKPILVTLIYCGVLLLAACAATPPQKETVTTTASSDGAESSAAKLRRASSQISRDLAASFQRNERLKVAVMPFTEMDGANVNYLGFYLAEKVNNELVVEAPQLDVLERNRIEEVLGELELGMSGLLDDASVQEAGRALGADALIVGSLAVIGSRDIAGSEIEVNVRVISVGLMKAVATTSRAILPDVAIWDMMDQRMAGRGPRTSTASRRSSGGVFVDDFNPSTGQYRFMKHNPIHPIGKYFFNDAAGRLEMRTGNNVGTAFAGELPSATTSGKVTVSFFPTQVYPKSGSIYLGIMSTQGDGYEFRFPKSHYPSSISYLVGGKVQGIWDRKGDSFGLNQSHTISLEYSPDQLIGRFDGVTIFKARNEHEFTVDTFKVSIGQMDCYIEKIEIE